MVGPLPADKGKGLTAVQQVNKFKPEILLLQCPIEKEDVRLVVFNDKNPGCRNNRSVFQACSPSDSSRQSTKMATIEIPAI